MVGAQQICQQENAELASVHNEAENEFIKGLIFTAIGNGGPQYRGGLRYHIWLGLQLERDGRNKIVGAKWTDGTQVDWANPLNWGRGKRPWAPGEPNDSHLAVGGRENCLKMYGQGRLAGLWNDISCTQTKVGNCGGCMTSDGSGAICKKAAIGEEGGAGGPTTTTTTTSKPTTSKCGDWKEFRGNCYRGQIAGEHGFPFEMAESHCQNNGAHLASIHSEAENKFITDIAKKLNKEKGKQYFWIGLQFVPQKNRTLTVKWTDGSRVDFGNPIDNPLGQRPWADGEPNKMNVEGENEDCTMLYGFDGPAKAGQWNDLGCERAKAQFWGAKGGFVCKKPAQK